MGCVLQRVSGLCRVGFARESPILCVAVWGLGLVGFARVLRCLGIIDLKLNHGACWVFGSRRGLRVGVRVGGFRGQGFRVWGVVSLSAGLLELWAYGSGSGLKILDSYMLSYTGATALRRSEILQPACTESYALSL